MEEKIKELFANEEFMAKVLPLSPEEAQKEFAKEGVEITVDELNDIAEGIKLGLNQDGEFTAEELDAVAGGRKKSHWISFGVGVALGVGAVAAASLLW